MARYQVKIAGKVVWKTTTPGKEQDVNVFPAEYLDRPETGTVHLIIDGEVVGCQVALSEDGAE